MRHKNGFLLQHVGRESGFKRENGRTIRNITDIAKPSSGLCLEALMLTSRDGVSNNSSGCGIALIEKY